MNLEKNEIEFGRLAQQETEEKEVEKNEAKLTTLARVNSTAVSAAVVGFFWACSHGCPKVRIVGINSANVQLIRGFLCYLL